jgi:DNA-binding response OmpR family regulator
MAGQCILAIEGDWRIRKLIRANLEAGGFRVQEAVSGRHGLRLLQESQPDLILLDMDLPQGDAIRLLGALQAMPMGRRLSVVVMSDEPQKRWLAEHQQVVGFLCRPFSVCALLEIVWQALHRTAIGELPPLSGGDDSISFDAEEIVP